MKKIFALFIALITSSCFFGPVKELKYQIEDSFDEGEPLSEPSKISNISQTKSTKIIWRSKLESNLEHKTHLFHNNDILFAISSSGNLTALNAEDGLVIWTKKFNVKVSSGLSGNDSIIVFTSEDGYIYCVDYDGKLLWKSFFGRILSPPLVLDDFMVLRRDDNLFTSFDILEGNIIWKYQAPSSPLTLNTQGKMIYSDGVVYSGLPNAKLIALEATSGFLIWEATISRPKGTSDIDKLNDITSQPVIDNSLIFTVSMNGDVACLDRKTSEILWTRPLSSFVGITDHLDEVLVVHHTDSIYSLNKLTGKSNWRIGDLKGRSLTTGIIIDDYFITGDFEGYLHIIDVNTGVLVGRLFLESDEKILNNLTKNLDDSFYAVNTKGIIYKLKLVDVDIQTVNAETESSVMEDDISEESSTFKLFDKLKDKILN
jgi:outer membrane protein assembly factor BamB